jgi:hypothetical protein
VLADVVAVLADVVAVLADVVAVVVDVVAVVVDVVAVVVDVVAVLAELPSAAVVSAPMPSFARCLLALAVGGAAACAPAPPTVTLSLAPAASPALGAVRSSHPGASLLRPVWARRLGGEGDQRVEGLAVDGAGNVAIVGYFEQTADFGAGALSTAPDEQAMFVALLDERGQARWSRAFGATKAQPGSPRVFVAFDPDGELVVAGAFSTPTLDLGLGPLARAGDTDVFVAKLDTFGRTRWARRFGGRDWQALVGLAVDASGGIVLAGTFVDGTLDFGLGALPNAGRSDLFVAALDPRGAARWSRGFGGAGIDDAVALAVSAQGEVVVAGTFEKTIDFGGETLVSEGGPELFVAALDAQGGARWSRRIARVPPGFPAAVAVDPAGNVAVSAQTAPSYGEVPRAYGVRFSFDVALLDRSGRPRWSRRSSGWGAGPLLFDGAGKLWMLGMTRGAVDFGGEHRLPAGDDQIFAAAFSLSGTPLGGFATEGSFHDRSVSAVVDPRTDAVLFAVTSGAVPSDVGTGPLEGAGSDVVLVRLAR